MTAQTPAFAERGERQAVSQQSWLTCLTALAVLARRQRLGAHPRRASAETAVHEGGAPAADDDPWRSLERHEIQLDQKLLVVKGSKGVIGCAYLDVGMFETLGEACAIIPAVDTAAMLDSKVEAATPRARELGIEVGMPVAKLIRPRPSASLVNASPG